MNKKRYCAAACLAGALMTCHVSSALGQTVSWPSWLRPPALTDQRPKFEALGYGITPTDAETIMGAPTARHELGTVLGASHSTLIWVDLNSRYTARFLAGRLYLKEQGPLITGKGTQP